MIVVVKGRRASDRAQRLSLHPSGSVAAEAALCCRRCRTELVSRRALARA
jgi:hypothetical protein